MGHIGATLAPYLFKTKWIPAWDAMGFSRRPHPLSDVSRILSAIEHGDPTAVGQRLPLVYEELRRLAARKLARELSGLTLQPTALVHEAYIRPVGGGPPNGWDGCGHFFAAAAEAMRRIPVEAARRRKAEERDGGRERAGLGGPPGRRPVARGVAGAGRLAGATRRLEPPGDGGRQAPLLRGTDQRAGGGTLAVSPRAADSLWAYARAWLFERMNPGGR
jgi:hypothetical protein